MPEVTGCERFASYVEDLIRQSDAEGRRPAWLMATLAERCANVDLRLLRRPLQFWRSLRRLPPVCFGRSGFRGELVDDYHPARHYCAFLAVGFFLPEWLAFPFATIWEGAEHLVFGEHSPRDVALSRVAIRHGRLTRREGIDRLPGLIRSELGRPAGRCQPAG